MTTGLVTTPPSLALTYDSEGNIQTRSVGGVPSTYAYDRSVSTSCVGTATPGPHAVTQAGSMKYCYDASGNVTKTLDPSGLRTFAYTSYDLLSSATSSGSGNRVDYEYGPNRERLRRLDYATATATSTTDVTHYVGSAEMQSARTLR